jgi:hypothetical protein
MVDGLLRAWLAVSAAVLQMIQVHFRLTLVIQSCNFFRNQIFGKN